MKKTISLSVLAFGIFFLAGCGQQQTSQTKSTTSAPAAQQTAVNEQANNTQAPVEAKPALDKKALEAAAYDAVNTKTKGVWDKKVEISTINESQKAVKGSWWAKDKWDWIAWQKDDGKWNVLVSMDGFNCKELDTVPSQYADFFKDVTNQFGKKYCY